MLFTKVLRPPFAYLRGQGHMSVVYMDDTYLQGDSFNSCQQNVYTTVNLLQHLGFNVNDKKSIFIPTQKLEFLGYILDSLLMTITLTACQKVALLNACSKLLQKSHQKIWIVSTVIGMIIAALPGVKHGALHYRTLESEKTAALCHNGDDYNGCMTLSPLVTVEIHWRHTNISTSHHFIRAPPPATTIYSDASLDGQGATNSLTTVGAPWEDIKDETFPDFSGIPDFLIAAYIFRKYQSPIISY